MCKRSIPFHQFALFDYALIIHCCNGILNTDWDISCMLAIAIAKIPPEWGGAVVQMAFLLLFPWYVQFNTRLPHPAWSLSCVAPCRWWCEWKWVQPLCIIGSRPLCSIGDLLYRYEGTVTPVFLFYDPLFIGSLVIGWLASPYSLLLLC